MEEAKNKEIILFLWQWKPEGEDNHAPVGDPTTSFCPFPFFFPISKIYYLLIITFHYASCKNQYNNLDNHLKYHYH